MRVSCIQLTATADKDANLKTTERLIIAAAKDKPDLIVLPEKWNGIGSAQDMFDLAESLDGDTLSQVAKWAQAHKCWILAGSVVIKSTHQSKLSNLSVLINPSGEQVAHYAKTHMFDVNVEGVAYRESDSEQPGNELVTTKIGEATLGLSICYDLRFPELYRRLALDGARIITVPAAFTERTGRDHWEVLLRARAIENQCFIVAANMIGDHGDGKRSYGRSMIIDPWGTVLATAPDAECHITSNLTLERVDEVRENFPALANRRADLYAIKGELR